MSRAFPWNVLGIETTKDAGLIRKAYAEVLRGLNVDEDIAGYANLRRARDEALWLAAQGDRDDEGDFGLGSLDDDDPFVVDSDYSDEWDDAPELYNPQASDDAPFPERSDAQIKAQTAWQALLDILYPGGEVSDDSVTFAEMEDGLSHLTVLLDHAERADLAEHDALDGALADVFARTWPRSAPFVEPANAALHWLDEAGQIEERPALRFLNVRLKGMRFHDKVQEPDHPLHKAWAELSRPGRAGFVDRLRVKRLDIDKLLTGLRQHYPELESHLAPERVASWEGSVNSGAAGETGPKAVRWVFVLVVVGSMLARLGGALSDSRNDDPQASFADGVEAVGNIELDLAATDIFGPGFGLAKLQVADPVFTIQLRDVLVTERSGLMTPEAFVRARANRYFAKAEFDELVARGELRRLWLAHAMASPELCRNVMKGNFNTIPLELDPASRARERQLLQQLLAAGLLSSVEPGNTAQSSVPGWVIEKTIARSGLSEDKVTAALQDPNSSERCLVEFTLLGVVLEEPGRVSPDLLRAL